MARKRDRDRAKAEAHQRSPRVGVPRAPGAADEPSPTADEVRQAVLGLLALGARCLTSEQRGYTSLTKRDVHELRSITKRLDLVNTAVPLPGSTSQKTQSLSEEQANLGCLRDKFDSYCGYAARQRPSQLRDFVLVAALTRACSEEFPALGASLEIVAGGINAMRKRLLGVDGYTGGDEEPDDWLIPEPNWDAQPGKSKNKPLHASPVAGELLREVISRCPAKPNCGYSPSSTSDYAAKFIKCCPGQVARSVTLNERLTLFASLLGVPLPDAPWVAFRIRLLLQGKDVDNLADPTWKDEWALRAFAEFRLPERSEWREMRRAIEERLHSAGLPKNGETEALSYHLAASHLRPAGSYAGREIPAGTDLGRTRDPWDPSHSDRRTKERLERLLRTDPAAFIPGDAELSKELSHGVFPDHPMHLPGNQPLAETTLPFGIRDLVTKPGRG